MNICVFCASSPEVNELFKGEARKLGHFIADKGHTLVYGGATGGLMDAVAEAVSAHGGEIIGIVPDLIVEKDRKSNLPTQLFQVSDMSERKEMMKEYADIFVVLPGGFGTLDEMFDVLASGMVGYHDKPTILVNVAGYYNPLFDMIASMEREHLGYKSRRGGLRICNSTEEAVEWLQMQEQI